MWKAEQFVMQLEQLKTLWNLLKDTVLMVKWFVMIDFKKAFDTVSRNFLFKTLQAFGFGYSFIRWIHTFYKNISSCVLNNGFSTAPFSVERGVRQRDPLSPYLFIIVLETLCISIRRSKDIQGITVDAEEIKLGLFADDLTGFLRNDISLHKFLEKLLENVQASGLIMIRLKSCYLAIVCAPF